MPSLPIEYVRPLAAACLAAMLWIVPAPVLARDGFDPGVIDPGTGEPVRVPFPVPASIRGGPDAGPRLEGDRPATGALEEEGSHYTRWRWFWAQRADHAGVIATGERWRRFLDGEPEWLTSSTAVPAAQWTTLGPNTMQGIGGRMLCAAFHPTNPETLYAGSNSGGLWWTRNGGTTWEPLTDQLPAMSVSSVAVNPSNPSEMLIGTGWGWALAVSGYAGVGVLRSTDAGLTWGATSFSHPIASGVGTFDLEWDPVRPERVHLAANNGYYRSLDGGLTWQLRLSGFCTALVVHPRDPDTLYVAVGGNGIYRSHDGGQTLHKLATGLPAGFQTYLFSLSICRDQPDILYTAVTAPSTFCLAGLYKTTDRGDTWAPVAGAPDVTTLPGLGACYGWLFNVVSVSPTDPNLLLIAGMRTYRTANAGAVWTQKDYYAISPSVDPNLGYLYVDAFDFAWHPNGTGVVYGMNDGGVWKSSNSGLTWQPRSEGLMTGLMYRVASSASRPEILVAGTQDQGLQRLDHTAGNLRWTRWSGGDGEVAIIDPTNPQIVYGVRDGGNRIKSTTGASTYVVNGSPIMGGITEASRFLGPMVMNPADPQVLWTATLARVYRSGNGGALWQPRGNLPNVATIAIDHVDPRIVYAHAYDNSTSQMWRTLDDGVTWTQLTDPSVPGWRVTDLETDPTRSGVVYATRNSAFPGQDHVKRSTDFGATWADLTADLPDVTTSAIAVSPVDPDHLYLATDLGVFLSLDGGGSWHEWNDGLPRVYASDLHYLATDRTVRVATLGRGVWKSPAHDVWVGVQAGPAPPAGLEPRVSPNPSLADARIRFAVAREDRVAVAVFDVTGQRVRVLVEEPRAAGRYEVSWDGRNDHGQRVAPGVYFVRVRVGGAARSVRTLRL